MTEQVVLLGFLSLGVAANAGWAVAAVINRRAGNAAIYTAIAVWLAFFSVIVVLVRIAA